MKESGQVVLTIPRRMAARHGHDFVRQHEAWIWQQLKLVSERQRARPSTASYHAYRARALKFVSEKVKQWNERYGVSVAGISIRRQSTRWGSASRSGRLNFNYQMFWLPEHLADYIVVHELCHLKEMNHSRRFWAYVSKTIPDYRKIRHELKKYRCG